MLGFAHLLVNIFLVNVYIYTGELNFIVHRSRVEEIRCEENYKKFEKIGLMTCGLFALVIIVLFLRIAIFMYTGDASVVRLGYLLYLARIIFSNILR